MKTLGALFIAVAVVLLVPALFLWWDGSTIGVALAWLGGIWGLLFLGWGVLARWRDHAPACLVAAAAGATSAALVLGWGWPEGEWSLILIGCAVGGALCFVAGILLARRRLRSRA